jgi:phosphatidylinositol-4,5-bisphosphate 3-kinase
MASATYDKKNFQEYLICLDPDTRIIYSINLVTYQVHIEQDVPESVKQKAAEAVEQMYSLRDPVGPTWIFHSAEARRYRRRKIPPYLLHRDAGNYPVILIESSLSGAFAKTTRVDIDVDLSNYKEQIEEATRGSYKAKKINLNVDLVTG